MQVRRKVLVHEKYVNMFYISNRTSILLLPTFAKPSRNCRFRGRRADNQSSSYFSRIIKLKFFETTKRRVSLVKLDKIAL